MGYIITIGNAEQEPSGKYDVGGYGGKYVSTWHVPSVTLEGSPCDGSPTDGTNERLPSYSGWYAFMDDSGLHDLFKNEDTGIMREHPGCFALTEEHWTKIAHACVREEHNKGRLEWLKFWVRWALDNCERPAIKNT